DALEDAGSDAGCGDGHRRRGRSHVRALYGLRIGESTRIFTDLFNRSGEVEGRHDPLIRPVPAVWRGGGGGWAGGGGRTRHEGLRFGFAQTLGFSCYFVTCVKPSGLQFSLPTPWWTVKRPSGS